MGCRSFDAKREILLHLNSEISNSTFLGTPVILNVFFTRAFQDRLQSILPSTVNAVNPGFCNSNLRHSFRGSLLNVVMLLAEKLLAFAPEQGSLQIVYGAIDGERTRTV